jgi:hypothetical protein
LLIKFTAEKVPLVANKPFVHYGASFLVNSVQMEESSANEPHDKVSQYLRAGPEATDNVVQWWGVHIHEKFSCQLLSAL